ncbi:MAG: DUF58 domain-containing protein, partial [Armatimonadota bacterium]|nr:DUF58 domain-containing protein [Armatimonadota bacterium]
YMQVFTPGGRWFLWSTAAFAAYGTASLDLQAYVPFAYSAALWGVAVVAALFSRPHVRLSAQHAGRVCAGETLPVEIEVRSAARLPATHLYVLPHRLPSGIQSVPPEGVLLPPLAPGEKARIRLGLQCNRRGVYRSRGFQVQTDFPLGLIRSHRTFLAETPLIIYPAFTRLARLELASGRRYHPGGVALASSLGDAFEFIGSREYREGDNIRDIDWRATARLSKPIVREYKEEYFLRVAVILDTHVPPQAKAGRRAEFERAVSVCAAVSDFMARQDYLVDLLAAGPNLYHLTAGRSLAYLDQILDILACVDINPEEPFRIIEPEILEHLSKITTVVCVFLDWNETRQQFVYKLRQEGAGCRVIIVRDGPCTLDPAAEIDQLGPIPVIAKTIFEAGITEL